MVATSGLMSETIEKSYGLYFLGLLFMDGQDEPIIGVAQAKNILRVTYSAETN